VTPEAEQSFARARLDLTDARAVAAFPIARVAARLAYTAAFHAAEPYIVERTGKVAKTHSGVRSEFLRLLKEESGDVRAFGRTLKDGYHFKEVADYSVDPTDVITDREAADMIEAASAFIDGVATLLA
jgi:uncharacterized protein (UPF0332 family)